MSKSEEDSKEQQLRSGDNRLSRIVESARLGTWEWNIETGELVWSRECLDMFGLPHDTKMSYERFLEAILPEDRERIDQACQFALATGNEYSTEMRAQWPDGTIHWVASRGRAYFDRGGKPIRMSGAGMDITRLKETEEDLKRARAEAKAQADNLAAVFDAMPAAAFFSHDRKCERVTSNRAAYELLRMPYGSNTSLSAPQGERPSFVVLEKGHEVAAEELPLQKAAITGRPVRSKEFEIRFPDGSSIYEFGHAVPLFDEEGQVRGAVAAFMDVTDRKIIEARLRASTERFKIALRGTPITVSNQGLDLRYTWIYNPFNGYNAVQIIGKRETEFLERMEDAVKMEAIKSEVMRTGVVYQGEVEIYYQGLPRTYHVTIEPQRDPQNRICGVMSASFDLTDRKREEAEREKLARQRQMALDAAKMGWWRYDVVTKISTWDDRFKKILGLTANSGAPEMVAARIHPEDREAAIAKLWAALESGRMTDYSNEYRIVRTDGSVRWIESRGTAETESDTGRVVAFAGTAQDITERKVTEDKLQQNQQAFAKLVENAPYGVYVVDSQFRLALTDPGSRTGAFRNVEPLDGRDFGEVMRILWPEPLASQIISTFRHTLQTGEPYYSERFRNLRKDLGDVKAYEWELHRIVLPDGQYGVVCYYFDSTEMRNIEDALLRQRERAEFVAEGSDVGFWFCDLPFDKLAWDKRVRKHFWLPDDDSPVTIGMFYSLLHPDDREPTRLAIEDSITNNKQYDVEYRTIAPDGRQRWVRAIGRTFYDAPAKPVRFDGITEDITARKTAEEALRQSEARYRDLAEHLEQEVQVRTQELRQRNEDVLRTSEELRALSSRLLLVQDEERRRIARDLHDSSGQILTAIGMDLANIAEQAQSKAVQQVAPKLAKHVEETQNLVQALHRELRTTSYLLHPPLLDEAGLFSAISWYVQGLTQRSDVSVHFDVPEAFGRLPREIELVIFRLVQESLTNILRHSGVKAATVRMTRGSDAVKVEIKDGGKGIPPEKLAAIDSGKTGLGIRAMRERLRHFGGELRIESNGAGTHVFVTIPIATGSDLREKSGIEPIQAAI